MCEIAISGDYSPLGRLCEMCMWEMCMWDVARRRADLLPFCAAVAYAAHPLLGHGALFFPVVAKVGAERYGGVANSLSGPPSHWPTSTAGSPWYQVVAVPQALP